MATEQNVRMAVLWDLDGVLADNSHAMNGKSSYHEMTAEEYKAMPTFASTCAVIEGYATLMQLLYDRGYYNIIFTNRSEDQREVTVAWLIENQLPYDLLSMRVPNTSHEGSKRDRLAEVMRGFIVVLALDDDPEAVAAYRAVGIPTIYVHSGYHAGLTSQVAVH